MEYVEHLEEMLINADIYALKDAASIIFTSLANAY